jgi:phosphatidate cytidylyltransferase
MVQELKNRFLWSAVSLFIVALVIYFSELLVFKFIFVGVVSALVGVGIWEYFQLAKGVGLAPKEKVGIAVGVIFVWAVFASVLLGQMYFLPWFVFVLAIFLSFVSYRDVEKNSLANIAVTIFGFVYVAFNLSLLVRIRYLDPEIGCWWLMYLLVVTKLADVGALLVGRTLGKHKLVPKVSPKKTVEGLIGGLIFGVVGGVLVSYFGGVLSWKMAVLLSLVLSFFGVMGDLAESILKRSAGVKDSNSLPGLGGVLDMVDSLLFTTPMVYIVMRIL